MTSPEVNELDLARLAYAGATRRAARAWDVICKLREIRVWAPKTVALNHIADTVYYSPSYDAHARYSDVEEFKEALVEELDGTFAREIVGGVECYALKPVLADWAKLGEGARLLNYMR